MPSPDSFRDGSRGSFNVLDGALYTALHRMEEQEWVLSEWGTRTRASEPSSIDLTAAGRRALRAETESWNEYAAAVGRVMIAVPQS